MVASRGLGLAVVHVFAFSLLAVRAQAVELRLPSAEASLEVGDAADVCDIPSGSGQTSEVCQVLERLISARPMIASGIVTSGVFALVTNPVRKDLDSFSVVLLQQRAPGAGKWSEEEVAKYFRGVAEGSHGTTTSLGLVRINGFPVLKLHSRSIDSTESGMIFTFVRRESLVSLQVTGPVAQSVAVETYAETIAYSLKMPNDASKDFGGRRASGGPSSAESGCCAKKRLVFTTGHGEANPATELQGLMAKLEGRFETITVDPSSQAIGTNVDVVVVGGPQQRFDEKGLRELDRAIRSARGAVILAPSTKYVPPRIDGGRTQYGRLQANLNGLEKLLAAYGFRIASEVVVDRDNAAPGALENREGRLFLFNLPQIVGKYQDPSARERESGPGRVFPFASPVDLVGPLAKGKQPSGTMLRKLAVSSKNSVRQSLPIILSPPSDAPMPAPVGAPGVQPLGYLYEGPLRSALVAKPSRAGDKDAPPSPPDRPVRLVVIGSSFLASSGLARLARLLPIYEGSMQMLADAITWIAGDGSPP